MLLLPAGAVNMQLGLLPLWVDYQLAALAQRPPANSEGSLRQCHWPWEHRQHEAAAGLRVHRVPQLMHLSWGQKFSFLFFFFQLFVFLLGRQI